MLWRKGRPRGKEIPLDDTLQKNVQKGTTLIMPLPLILCIGYNVGHADVGPIGHADMWLIDMQMWAYRTCRCGAYIGHADVGPIGYTDMGPIIIGHADVGPIGHADVGPI